MNKGLAFLFLLGLMLVLDLSECGKRGWRRGHRQRDHHRRGHRGQDKHSHRDRHMRFRDYWPELRQRIFGASLDKGYSPFLSFDFDWGTDDNKHKPWWEGPNVCESVSEENGNRTDENIDKHSSSYYMKSCDESEAAYKCTEIKIDRFGRREKTTVLSCCHGHTREKGEFGCPTEMKLANLKATAISLGLTEFIEVLNALNLEPDLEDGNFTVFAPVNGAFGLDSDIMTESTVLLKDSPTMLQISEPAAEKTLQLIQDAVLGHLILGARSSTSFADDEILSTGSEHGSTIRINFFSKPKKLTTANCVKVESMDNLATNGVIHTLGKALRPVTNTLTDLVAKSTDLTKLKTLLAVANMVSDLDDSQGKLTLLAPSDSAFEKLEKQNPRLYRKLFRGDQKCVKKLIQAHILPNVICSTAIQGKARTKDLLSRYVKVERTEDDKLFVEKSQIIKTDTMAHNGVLHIIDDVLIPEEVKDAMAILEKENFTEFLELVTQAGLKKELELAENITLFVPTNEAIQSLPTAVTTKLKNDPDLLKEVVGFHVATEEHKSCHLYDNKLLPSMTGKHIRINSYHNFPYHSTSLSTAQCAPITVSNKEVCNGRINVLENVMIPPKGNILDALASDKKFSTLVGLLKKSGMAEMLQTDGPYTIFAPNNEAFNRMSQETLQSLQADEYQLKKVISRHLFERTLCCSGIFSGWYRFYPKIRTHGGEYLEIQRNANGKPKIHDKVIAKCDIPASNGNILEMDDVIMPRKRRSFWNWH